MAIAERAPMHRKNVEQKPQTQFGHPLEPVVGSRSNMIKVLDQKLHNLNVLARNGLINKSQYKRDRHPILAERKKLSGDQAFDRSALRRHNRSIEKKKGITKRPFSGR